MDWLYENGFLSWGAVLVIFIAGHIIWTERKHAKTPMGKRHKAWLEELKKQKSSRRNERESS